MIRRLRPLLLCLVLMEAIAAQASAAEPGDHPLQTPCSSLGQADFSAIPEAPAQVLSAIEVKASEEVPSYCKVTAYVANAIGVELGLPTSWNGKLTQMGCAGHCGVLDDDYFLASCEGPLRRGYACVISDLGHRGGITDGLWGYHNLPAKLDWGLRGTHVSAVVSKALLERYYSKQARRSYFLGCSTGGRQALQEAQRFPWDFNGIVAGAPPVTLSSVYLSFAWGMRAAREPSGGALLGIPELKLLTAAALAQCDLRDGLKDGIIGDPLQCPFDPAVLACKSGQTRECLSPRQIEAVRKIYGGPVTSAGVRLSSGGPLPGSEYALWAGEPNDWSSAYLASGGPQTQPGYDTLVTNGFRYLLFMPDPGPRWTLADLDFDRDYQRLGLMEAIYDSSNPDLRKFKAAGGKLLMYQGANDNSVLPRATIDYYETVERTMGGRAETQDFARLFILPGVAHCLGGAGAFAVDYLHYLDAWVENGQAPDELLSSHVRVDDLRVGYNELVRQRLTFPLEPTTVEFSRPVYPYPTMTHYLGRGDPKEATSFGPAL